MRSNIKVESMRTELSRARTFAKTLEDAVREMASQRGSVARTRNHGRARENLGASILMLQGRLQEVRARAEKITQELQRFERF
ncbi:MAG: hypothetical protein OXF09_02610 [Hyphomicrobiales bacterium]|nr:hypothetical protein [Hyphomicrobiales bacterium]MCY4038332.1 hypothetical protein [Hyphomicrobiales bacterium]